MFRFCIIKRLKNGKLEKLKFDNIQFCKDIGRWEYKVVRLENNLSLSGKSKGGPLHDCVTISHLVIDLRKIFHSYMRTHIQDAVTSCQRKKERK